MELADKIKAYREDNNLTQEQFAEMGGLTRVAVAAIESGRNQNVRLETLIGIAKAMNISLDELVKE